MGSASEIDSEPAAPGPHFTAVPPLKIAGATFGYEDQKFVIQAMCFFDYSVQQVAPCLGLHANGTPRKSYEQVQAACDFFRHDHGLLCDQSILERDDARFECQVKEMVNKAGLEQAKLQLQAKLQASVTSTPNFD